MLVHTSLKALGYVVGGTRSVVEALIETAGTVMMPVYSGDLSDPAEWRHPPAPPEKIDAIREAIPAYDPILTPSRGMGAVPEYFRTYPGTIRSPHPQSSFVARGPMAQRLVGEHPLDNRFGPDSPLGALVRLGGKTLLLGAPRNTCSMLYLTEHELYPKSVAKRAPMNVGGKRQWVEYRDIKYTDRFFKDAIAMLLENSHATFGRVGQAESVLIPAATVQIVSEWRRTRDRT